MKRDIDTLRISVTDRCNLRCNYCMPPEGIEPMSHDKVLTFEEIIRLSRIFAGLGIMRTKGLVFFHIQIISLHRSKIITANFDMLFH